MSSEATTSFRRLRAAAPALRATAPAARSRSTWAEKGFSPFFLLGVKDAHSIQEHSPFLNFVPSMISQIPPAVKRYAEESQDLTNEARQIAAQKRLARILPRCPIRKGVELCRVDPVML